ncbi:MAG TPA: trehalase-like domain-containing protein, partial [Anaeromyxobacteraceae bacterium]
MTPCARIGDHAAIGDGRSAALVTREGAIDWLCWPRFDSPAVFARLLDSRGGELTVRPVGAFKVTRRYLPDTNVLETRFDSRAAALVLLDLMPLVDPAEGALVAEREILRIARCERGEVELEIVLDARPGFGREPRRWSDEGALGLQLRSGRELFVFRSEPRLPAAADGGVRARVLLRPGATARFSFSHALDAPAVLPPLGARAEDALERTIRRWRAWASQITYQGRFRDAVVRSALALKLLAHSPSGAIVAAATTSLPERPGGFLNWDYRYCW